MLKLVGGTAGDLFAGFDVGRTRNASELIVLEQVSGRLIFRRRPYKWQSAVLPCPSLQSGQNRDHIEASRASWKKMDFVELERIEGQA